jgi:hypothetical protein
MGQLQSIVQDWASACYDRVRPVPAKVHIVSEDEGATVPRHRNAISGNSTNGKRITTKVTSAAVSSDTERSGTNTPIIKR